MPMSNNTDAEYEDEAFQEGGANEESTREKRKRKRKGPPVKRACLNCRKSHVSCSEQRPCHRCVAKGIPCIDASSSKQQTASLEALLLNLAQNIGSNVQQQQQPQATNFHAPATAQTPAAPAALNFNFDTSANNNNATSMQNIPSFLLPLVMQQQQQQSSQQQQPPPQQPVNPSSLSFNGLMQPSTPLPSSSPSVNILNGINAPSTSSRSMYFPAPQANNGMSNSTAAEAFLDKVMLQQRIAALEQELSELKLAKQQQQQQLQAYSESGRNGLNDGMFSRVFQKYKTPVTVWDTKTTLLSCNEAFAVMIKEDADQSKRKMNAGTFNIVKNAKAETASFALLIMDTVYQVKKQSTPEPVSSLPLVESVKLTDALRDYYGNTIYVEHTVNFEPGFFWIESVPLVTDHYDDQIEIDNVVVHPKTMEIRPTNHNFKMQVLQKMCMVLQHLEQAAQKKKQLHISSASSSYPSPNTFHLKFGSM